MAKFFTKLGTEHRNFINQQKIFFTATASHQGRVNISPKGMDTFCCLSETVFAYLDLTGSGNETAAHVENDGRITIMFCSFEKQPLILRIYGRGTIVHRHDEGWMKYYPFFKPQLGARQIILLNIESVQTSCGFSIPFYEYKEERPTLIEWSKKKGEQGLEKYWQEKNQTSIDGLPTHLLEKE